MFYFITQLEISCLNFDAQFLGIRLFGFFLQEVSTESRCSEIGHFLLGSLLNSLPIFSKVNFPIIRVQSLNSSMAFGCSRFIDGRYKRFPVVREGGELFKLFLGVSVNGLSKENLGSLPLRPLRF